MSNIEHLPWFVTVTQGMRGWFAVLMWWNPDGFHEPWQSGIGSYPTREGALGEASDWAMAEELPLRV